MHEETSSARMSEPRCSRDCHSPAILAFVRADVTYSIQEHSWDRHCEDDRRPQAHKRICGMWRAAAMWALESIPHTSREADGFNASLDVRGRLGDNYCVMAGVAAVV